MQWRLRSLFCSMLLACSLPAAAQSPPEAVEFFEKRVRPVLVAHCYSCHSKESKKQRGGLLLDSGDGIRQGGDSGPVVVPGKPGESRLLRAVRHIDELRMPPKQKLPEAVIADLERWVLLGAPYPADRATTQTGLDLIAARRHWAYQPIRRPAIPDVSDPAWATSPIDRFILAKLEANRLRPAPPADRRTLLRRVYYDLIGLPPTFEEVETFVRDAAPDAFARVVERLLASPHYGERWGRHWLDVARYADTKDQVLLYGKDRIRPYAYTYRDYVVRALNEDTPVDRFFHEQLAADQVAPKDEPWRLAAMGFLTLGRMFCGNFHDVHDDQIDTITRGMLGLTVSCARCHDHKYDAITAQDYYALYGVFASSELPIEFPVLEPANSTPAAVEFEKKLREQREKLQRHVDSQYEMLTEAARARIADYLVRVTEQPDLLEDAVFFLSLSPDDLRPPILSRWRRYLSQVKPADPVFGPWNELMRLPEADYARGAAAVVARWKSGAVNSLVVEALSSAALTSKADVARAYGALLKRVYEESRKSPETLPPDRQQLVALLTSKESPTYFTRNRAYLYMSRVPRTEYGSLLQSMDKLAVQSEAAPPRAMVLVDAAELYEPRVFQRGNPALPGERVPRSFLAVLSGPERRAFTHGSGRLDLAKAITAPDNPLTSRVFVNRVWMHHFGEPLAPNPSDFGTRSGPPSHPELLDYLAAEFMADGWSLKNLHRRILLSNAYQQSSRPSSNAHMADPDNRLLSHFPRRRLDFEAMRDTLLTVAGRMDRRLGGRPIDVAGDPLDRRRTLYGLVDRQDLPNLYRAFDFAVPDVSVERRPQTIVPQQALFALNAPFVLEQARAIAIRPEVRGESTPERRVAALYRVVLARAPEPVEVQLGVRFATTAVDSDTQLSGWEQLAQVLLLTNEMMFVD